MYKVDEGLCVGCRVCLNFCEKGALSMAGDVAVIDQQRCGDCGGCYDACLQDAIYELNKPRRVASACRPMYGIESPFPHEERAPDPPGPPTSWLKRLSGLSLRRRP